MDAETQRALMTLQAENAAMKLAIQAIEKELGDAQDRWGIVLRMLINPPDGNKDGPSGFTRIMAVVEGYERASWLGKWLIRIFWALPPAVGAVAAYLAWFRGPQ